MMLADTTTTMFALVLGLLLVLSVGRSNNNPTCVAAEEEEEDCNLSENNDQQQQAFGIRRSFPDTCRTVLADFSQDDDGGKGEPCWGVFSLVERKRGTPVETFGGDIVIPIVDLPQKDWMTNLDMWDGSETGCQYEGLESVKSIVPGLGMLVNFVSGKADKHNLIPLAPRIDEGGLTRLDSPGAGATTHYHNYTIYNLQNIAPGEELLWSDTLVVADSSPSSMAAIERRRPVTYKPSLEELKEIGYCLDNMFPAKSRIKEAGHGAFANRDIPKGSIIAPAPLVKIPKSDISSQLLRNYCFGHKYSSTLLFPYGPIVNLINHYTEPNVKFQWKDDNSDGLFMELVATRSIKEGEEVYLDYGRDWEDAWWKHVKDEWKPADFHYTPSYVMDDVIKHLRTEKELKDHPYPENVFTSCFYKYSDRTEEEKRKALQSSSSSSVISYTWKLTERIYDLKYLRPCKVLNRKEDSKGQRSAYAVRMFNRPGLSSEEQIPKGDKMHIVTHVPRSAIRFSDKAGTTDMHLPYAFRHEMGLSIFPESLMDLVPFAAKDGEEAYSSEDDEEPSVRID